MNSSSEDVPIGTAIVANNVHRMIYDRDKFYDEPQQNYFGVHNKSENERYRIKEELLKIPYFIGRNEAHLQTMIDTMEKVETLAGERIFNQGDDKSSEMFIVAEGVFQIFIDGILGETLRHSGHFGELAMLNGGQRFSTALSVSDGILWKLHRRDFKLAIVQNFRWSANNLVSAMDLHRKFDMLTRTQKHRLILSMKEKIFDVQRLVLQRVFCLLLLKTTTSSTENPSR
ncbi:hypothetical protein ACOME3_006113 [Neoechinorhynchus agilis]